MIGSASPVIVPRGIPYRKDYLKLFSTGSETCMYVVTLTLTRIAHSFTVSVLLSLGWGILMLQCFQASSDSLVFKCLQLFKN